MTDNAAPRQAQNIFDEDTLLHIMALNNEGNKHWQAFLEFLDKRGMFLSNASCAQKDEVICRWMQGRVHEVADLLMSVKTAKEAKARYQKGREPVQGGALL